jgi:hypothetical protein
MRTALILIMLLKAALCSTDEAVIEEGKEVKFYKGKHYEYHHYHLFNSPFYEEKAQFFSNKGLIPFTAESHNIPEANLLEEKGIFFGAAQYFIVKKEEVDKSTIFITNAIHTCTAFILTVDGWMGASHQISTCVGYLELVLELLKKEIPNWDNAQKKAHLIGSYLTAAQIKMKEILDMEGFQLKTFATAPIFNYLHEEQSLITYIGVGSKRCSYSFPPNKPPMLMTTVGFTVKGNIFWEHFPNFTDSRIEIDNKFITENSLKDDSFPSLKKGSYHKFNSEIWGDQKYIDDYPELFAGMKVLRQKALEQ